MRIGFNPQKDKKQELSDFFHQIIIPVYIPNLEGYFKESFKILEICINSILKTSHSKTYVTIVNNGSCNEVKSYLENLFNENKIHELIHTTSVGKLNSILKGLVGQSFPLITISDADVLFLNHWQKETYKVFDAFPKAGIVSTTPNSKMVKYLTGLVFIDNFFSKSLQFTNVLNPNAMQSFANSIGNNQLFNEVNLKKYFTISSTNNQKAVIGAGHFVATYRSEVFKTMKHKNSEFCLGGNSEYKILDEPVLNSNLWRLSTENNYTYHLGNSIEGWMSSLIEKTNNCKNDEIVMPNLTIKKTNNFIKWIKLNILIKILMKKPIWRLFMQYKGLSKDEALIY